MNARALPLVRPSVGSDDPSADLYANYPSGWFSLAATDELARGQVLIRRLAGRDVVLYRTDTGEARATEPHCPHMGAHLGHGGTVRGEEIRCPFHGFRFDAAGQCVATGYGTPPPPRARLGTYPVREMHDTILVWFGSVGEAPTFELPPVDTQGWYPMKYRTYPLRGHPQETSENSVDMGHLGIVHGYRAVDVLQDLTLDGAALHVKYRMDRPSVPGWKIPGPLGHIPAEFHIHVHGLGYSLVEVLVPPLGFRSRHYVFATPVDREQLSLRIGFSLQRGSLRMPRAVRGLGLARDAVERIAMSAGIRIFAHDVLQDFDIWQHKRYVHPPQLAQGDGPIGTYRRWAKQFYPGVTSRAARPE